MQWLIKVTTQIGFPFARPKCRPLLAELPSLSGKPLRFGFSCCRLGGQLPTPRHPPRGFKALHQFAGTLNDRSIVAILTSGASKTLRVKTLPHLANVLQFQLWVAVKLAAPIARHPQQLPEHHAALLVLSKYRTSLRHAPKTRIEYTYCPECDKTTKDYGGKKHTYHGYGTLVSDVYGET